MGNRETVRQTVRLRSGALTSDYGPRFLGHETVRPRGIVRFDHGVSDTRSPRRRSWFLHYLRVHGDTITLSATLDSSYLTSRVRRRVLKAVLTTRCSRRPRRASAGELRRRRAHRPGVGEHRSRGDDPPSTHRHRRNRDPPPAQAADEAAVLAGTRWVMERTEQTHVLVHTGLGSQRAGNKFVVHPDEVRSLRRGECFVISGGAAARARVRCDRD